MELSIRLECPQCNTALPLPLQELALGRRQLCDRCQHPVRLTAESLDRLASDLRCFCAG
jgi:uncharacterized paraquat-inducible protein A